MPVIFRGHGYTFYFYSHEPNEPPHIHVDKGDASAKVWLGEVAEVAVARKFGFKAQELARILTLVTENRTMLLEAWYGYFDPES